VYENMAFGLKRARYPKAEIEQRVQRAAKTLHIENLLTRRPRDLSGGQRQRVAIGRAIVREPKLFLFDEPLSNLDAALRVEMRVELAKLKAELGATIVYVTHDQIEAMTLADRIVVMNDGRVEQTGAPLDLYHAPANLFVAGFIGSPKMNFLPARAVRMQGSDVVVELFEGGAMTLPVTQSVGAGASLTLGVRPEHLRLSGGGGLTVPAEIVVAELLGGESYLHVRVPGQTMVVKTDGGTTPHRGDRIEIVLPPAQCHLFDADGRRISGSADAIPPEAL
jgi:multiple sugar transport system ATP-binding protein